MTGENEMGQSRHTCEWLAKRKTYAVNKKENILDKIFVLYISGYLSAFFPNASASFEPVFGLLKLLCTSKVFLVVFHKRMKCLPVFFLFGTFELKAQGSQKMEFFLSSPKVRLLTKPKQFLYPRHILNKSVQIGKCSRRKRELLTWSTQEYCTGAQFWSSFSIWLLRKVWNY